MREQEQVQIETRKVVLLWHTFCRDQAESFIKLAKLNNYTTFDTPLHPEGPFEFCVYGGQPNEKIKGLKLLGEEIGLKFKELHSEK